MPPSVVSPPASSKDSAKPTSSVPSDVNTTPPTNKSKLESSPTKSKPSIPQRPTRSAPLDPPSEAEEQQLSDADTEPLPFDEVDQNLSDQEAQAGHQLNMDAKPAAAEPEADAVQSELARQPPDPNLPILSPRAQPQSTSAAASSSGSPLKAGTFTGDEFSGESDLTDEPDDDEDENDDEEEDEEQEDDEVGNEDQNENEEEDAEVSSLSDQSDSEHGSASRRKSRGAQKEAGELSDDGEEVESGDEDPQDEAAQVITSDTKVAVVADADAEGDEEGEDEAEGQGDEAEVGDDEENDADGSDMDEDEDGRRSSRSRRSPRKSSAARASASPIKGTKRVGKGPEGEGEHREEDEDEDEEGELDDSTAGLDEAAQGLAALTGQAQPAQSSGPAQEADGLAGLAALASGESFDQVGQPNPSLKGAGGRVEAIKADAAEADSIQSSDVTPEPEEGAAEEEDEDEDEDEEAGEDEDEEEEGEVEGQGAAIQDVSMLDDTKQESSLSILATLGKRRAAATGGATSLLEDPVESLPPSAATSRAASPADDEQDPDKAASGEAPEEGVKHGVDIEGAAEEAAATAAGTPVPGELAEQGHESERADQAQLADQADHEEDTSTDEAALRRQEAMEALTKIEIGFAMLRDRLYVERLEEISKEGDMIADGTHPELIHLTNAIEARRERRMKLVEKCFEQQEKQYERVAKAEEFAAWNAWRTDCAILRRDMMDDLSRKRRKIDREKRTMDQPRPIRRHQAFEAELVRNPNRIAHSGYLNAAGAESIVDTPVSSKKRKAAAAKRRAAVEETEAASEYVAYPDLRGLNENDVWLDIERMGIRAAPIYDPYYRPEEMHHPDMYAVFGPDGPIAGPSFAAAGFGRPAGVMHPSQQAMFGTPQALHRIPVNYDGYLPDMEALHRHELMEGRQPSSPFPPEMYAQGFPPHMGPAMNHAPPISPTPHQRNPAAGGRREMELESAAPAFDAQQRNGKPHRSPNVSGHAATANRNVAQKVSAQNGSPKTSAKSAPSDRETKVFSNGSAGAPLDYRGHSHVAPGPGVLGGGVAVGMAGNATRTRSCRLPRPPMQHRDIAI
ncbi:hypothetical protein IE53DRAFT_36999 [Violaceomyces palustris]|uniref:Uncharacterized protein n=1 Tax=Violaceomyces palustris TaxID=1673888 RepID=A0ACD0P177_9BASI|nr:hypothetical protein IE53DRAFT_36999 [Violaceomyces palustris]